uniref:Arsenite methyltransferase n=1 Tax=Chromera velia CCMP2878 TaxID=1169474 RepID=A0A0G4FAB4_9ALVE|eukprot:Cvel_15879.t1-p1 / transcript=Cvel_15879.t1 / gene=Cvel_15879 / organism=Chromera_velia_CCMP2878 / gene_product=Arsenite methyltransferase, putative / transcript_product=Arsenite methyltransferase, putative / location=Cvel_scaffold1198:21467-22591(+) / protein_length=375 / sequence_SO=supercontig / SO=protein_coding / is_pseudo=false
MSDGTNGTSGGSKCCGGGQSVQESVKEYYGKVLKKSEDLKTNACVTKVGKMPPRLIDAHRNVHPEVIAKYYGCGTVFPDELKGKSVLDLGCGSGKDVYVLAQFVGETGRVVGVDMTDEQLETARQFEDWHREKFGFGKKNTEFIKGHIEELLSLAGLEKDSFDVIVSNCVINLSPHKEKVLAGAFHLLKDGGELFFSDVYADRRVPLSLQKDPVLWGECLSGALYWNDFLRLAREAGFEDPRLVSSDRITVKNAQVESRLGHIRFYSGLYRLFKLPAGTLESDSEDYGQAVRYRGSMEGAPEEFALDDHHVFVRGKIMTVCGNTWHMLKGTRFAAHFDFFGDFSTHFGIFPGSEKRMPFSEGSSSGGGGGGGGCC